MKTATVRDLRNHYTSLLRWLGAGEDVLITRRGKLIARMVPEHPQAHARVNWLESPAVRRDRSGERVLTAKESARLIAEGGGAW